LEIVLKLVAHFFDTAQIRQVERGALEKNLKNKAAFKVRIKRLYAIIDEIR
jgi:hypothetical protein